MTAAQYEEFRSLVPDIPDRSALSEERGKLIYLRHHEYKIMPPWEESEWSVPPWNQSDWKEGCLRTFDIDRVYHYLRAKHLYGRTKYRGKIVYFHEVMVTQRACDMFVSASQRPSFQVMLVRVYLTFDADVFLRAVLNKSCNPFGVWKMMREDGVPVDEPNELEYENRESWHLHGVPTLQFLCTKTVAEHKDDLNLSENLCPLLTYSVNQFIRARETRNHHDRLLDASNLDAFHRYKSPRNEMEWSVPFRSKLKNRNPKGRLTVRMSQLFYDLFGNP